MKDDRRSLLAGLGLIGLVAVAYANSLGGPFVFDDIPSILQNETITQLWPWWKPLAPPANFGFTVSGRPLVNLSLAINYAISGREAWSYHLFNLVIHGAAGLTLFGLVRRTLRRGSMPIALQQSAFAVAWVAAALWMVHPLQTESVTYVIQRAESMMGLCYLLTLYAFARSVQAAHPLLWRVVAVVICAMGMACKEVMVTAPLVVLLYDATFVADHISAALRARGRFYVSMAATWLVLGILVASTGGDRGGTFVFTAKAFGASLGLQAEAILLYLKLSVWPAPLIFEYGKAHVGLSWMPAVAMVVVGLLLLAIASGLRRRSILAFLGASFFLILSPTSLVPGTTQIIAEHRMYLPLAAVVVAIVSGIAIALGQLGLRLSYGLVGLAALFTWQRNYDYQSDLRLWSDTVAKRPTSALAHSGLATAYYERGEVARALPHYRESLRLDSSSAHTHYNLGLALEAMGQKAEAVAEYREAVKILPYHAEAEVRLGAALTALGRADEAIQPLEHAAGILIDPTGAQLALGQARLAAGDPARAIATFREVLARRPQSAAAELGWGAALMQMQHLPEALERTQRSLQINPRNAEAYFQLGSIHAAAGDNLAAIEAYRRVLELDAAHADSRLNLGVMLAQQGQLAEAEEQLVQVVRRRGDWPEAHTNLAIVLGELGKLDEAISHYESALRLRPDYVRAHYNLANALLRVNQLSSAAEHLRIAVELDPKFLEARELLERVETSLSAR